MDVQSQINSLNIVPSWKQKFLAISESKPVGGGIGHEFGDREKYKALPFWTKFSIWGLLFGALFYFFKGMWKKGLALIGLRCISFLHQRIRVLTPHKENYSVCK